MADEMTGYGLLSHYLSYHQRTCQCCSQKCDCTLASFKLASVSSGSVVAALWSHLMFSLDSQVCFQVALSSVFPQQ